MPHALVTGASAGIGRALARRFARGGYDLTLTARRADALGELAAELRAKHGREARVIAADLADPAAPERLIAEAGVPDVLVLNAGFGQHGPFAGQEPARVLAMIQVNVAALTHLTRLALPTMLEREAGRILTVASIAAYMPGPHLAVYYATKAYVLSLSEALSQELKGSGVTVTCLCPGPTRTEFAQAAGVDNDGLFKGAMDADAVAEAGYAACLAGRRVVVPGWRNRAGVLAARLAPRGVVAALVGRVQRRRSS